MAHIDAGKTTVTERILFYTGRVHKMGEVHNGNATMDWMPEEQERGITITSAATTCFWRNHQINIIDTPGHVDFTVEVERSLRVLDGAIGVFCGVAGVQPQSETVWHQAQKYNIPCMGFINKLDRKGAGVEHVIESIRDRLGVPAVAIQWPMGLEDEFKGVVDLVAMKATVYDDLSEDAKACIMDIPEEYLDDAEIKRHELIEYVAEKDDALLEKYAMDEAIDGKLLMDALRRLTLSGDVVPVLCGTALKNKGIRLLLDAVVDYMPSPLNVPPVSGRSIKTGEEITRKTSDHESLGCLAFKISADPYFGKMAFVRVYSGMLKKGANVFNPRTQKRERIGRILQLHANHKEDVDILYSGEIGGLVGVKNVTTGDTLCSENQPLLLETIVFPEPVIAMAIEPKSSADKETLEKTLKILEEEDPTFRVAQNAETGQMIIRGMGELHLEVLKDRMFREFKVKATAGKPMVAYRESIVKPAKAEHTFEREISGHGQYGHVILSVAPLERGTGNKISVDVSKNIISSEFQKAIIEGITDGLATGILGNNSLVDIEVRVVGGSMHPTDSTEIAFRTAAALALREAVTVADPVLLEPVMELEIITPEEYMGDVIGDISGRRGKIRAMNAKGTTQVVEAEAPLAELFGYATKLRSLTKGRASYSMEPLQFDIVPEPIKEAVLNR